MIGDKISVTIIPVQQGQKMVTRERIAVAGDHVLMVANANRDLKWIHIEMAVYQNGGYAAVQKHTFENITAAETLRHLAPQGQKIEILRYYGEWKPDKDKAADPTFLQESVTAIRAFEDHQAKIQAEAQAAYEREAPRLRRERRQGEIENIKEQIRSLITVDLSWRASRAIRRKREALRDRLRQLQEDREDDDLCFVTTAAYGDGQHPIVKQFRALRDEILVNVRAGRAFIRWYEKNGPRIAHVIARRPVFRSAARCALTPIAKAVRAGRWVINSSESLQAYFYGCGGPRG